MALDRRVTIERNHGERNEHGEFQDAWRTLAAVWADRSSLGAVDVVGTGGDRTVESAQFTVRWRSDLILADISLLRITDDLDQVWDIETIGESDARRRFVQITATREAV